MLKKFFIIFVLMGLSCAQAADYPEFIEQVFLTREQALKTVFAAQDFTSETHRLTSSQKEKIEAALGWEMGEDPITVYRGVGPNGKNGYALIAEEIGKFKPITFIVKLSEDKKVERVDVMVYREAVGAEVRKQRFLNQFKGKNSRSSLRINADIINLTGATMSAQAITLGVKKTVLIVQALYP